MVDLANYDPNAVSNPNNNIFGLPSSEEDARLVILPVPWEVTVSYGAGTARAPESIFRAALQVDLYDPDLPEGWKQGYYMRPCDRKLLMKSDYLRKEAELFIDYIAQGEEVAANQFMCRTVREVNEGGTFFKYLDLRANQSVAGKRQTGRCARWGSQCAPGLHEGCGRTTRLLWRAAD